MPHEKMKSVKNDGWEDVNYDFGRGEELNNRISYILNEACHVFHHHKDGNWKSIYKDRYAQKLVEEIEKSPSIIKQLKDLNDRVVKMVTYRAIELLNKK